MPGFISRGSRIGFGRSVNLIVLSSEYYEEGNCMICFTHQKIHPKACIILKKPWSNFLKASISENEQLIVGICFI